LQTLGYLGPAGSHSHAAALAFSCWAKDALPEKHTSLLPLSTLSQIIDTVSSGDIPLGCIPIENALEGSVNEVLDGLFESPLQIACDFVRPIRHALIRKHPSLQGIEAVYSHPQALGQCRKALSEMLGPDIKLISALSTAEAVKQLGSSSETFAAIGTQEAAQYYGFDVVCEHIGSLDHNQTRFLVISQQPEVIARFQSIAEPQAALKTSFCIELTANHPGALLAVLQILAMYKLNMSKIESRPTKQALGEYVFYIDIEGVLPETVSRVIREQSSRFQSLGTYPSFRLS
jgi:prephenate dehydratase